MKTFNNLRQCAGCNEDKPYNTNAKPSSKANGFAGNYCWDCFLMQKKVGAGPGYIERYKRLGEIWGIDLHKRGRPTSN